MPGFGVERGDVVMSVQFILAREAMQLTGSSSVSCESTGAAAAVVTEGGGVVLEGQEAPGAPAWPRRGPFDELIERTPTSGR
jgi:hypothetical protein